MSKSATDVKNAVHRLRKLGELSTAAIPIEGLEPMTSVCSVSRTPADEIALSSLPVFCPPDLVDFWQIADSARLFEDQQYGQWGLIILAPDVALSRTKSSQEDNAALVATDLIVGVFLGDSDLLAINCDKSNDDFGIVMVVSAIDPRTEWPVAAQSFGEFLSKYSDNNGEKYWE